MRNITKEFVEVLKCNIYGNEWEWVIVDKPYEERQEELNIQKERVGK